MNRGDDNPSIETSSALFCHSPFNLYDFILNWKRGKITLIVQKQNLLNARISKNGFT